jgi:hypothetical protein
MFRKPVHLSGEHAVSGADRKKLRRCALRRASRTPAPHA